jgi:pantoate--beta-alanine ligase
LRILERLGVKYGDVGQNISMKTYEDIDALRNDLGARRLAGKSIGLVPTMGALHEGHLSLIERARSENDVVVMSLFVNPTQFTDPEDFQKYPRDPHRDADLAQAAGADFIFAPTMEAMYPPGFDTVVAARAISEVLEGASRPGHFQGVATVVSKLFHIVSPDSAYFGQKDYQQVQVIKRMVKDLNVPIDIVVCPILREPDGVAMSSRNVRLSSQERKAAAVLFRAMSYAQQIADTGVHDAWQLAAWMAQTIEVEALARLDYAAIVDPEQLRQLDTIDAGAVALVAATFGKVRLIDNLVITPAPGAETKR